MPSADNSLSLPVESKVFAPGAIVAAIDFASFKAASNCDVVEGFTYQIKIPGISV